MGRKVQLQNVLQHHARELLDSLVEESEKIGVPYEADYNEFLATPVDEDQAQKAQFGGLIQNIRPKPFFSQLINQWARKHNIKR